MKTLNPLLIALLVLLGGCQEQSEISQSSLIYCAEGSPVTFNPHLSTSGVTQDTSTRTLYDRLLDVNPQTLVLEPALATRWQVSADGLRYSLTLRQGVKFHHTPWFTPHRPFNAHDVVFTYQRQLDKQHPYHFVSGGDYPYFYSLGLDSLLKRVYAKTPYEVVFELNEPNSAFLATLASDYAVIQSAEYADNMLKAGTPSLLDSRPIGTGPFQFSEYRHNQFTRYLRHPDYWGGAAHINQVIYDITPRASKRLAKLLTGECDITGTPAASQLALIKQTPSINLALQTGMNVAFLALNTQQAPFNNVKVRQAIASAINIDNLLHAVYFDSGVKARGLLPPLSWGYNPTLPERTVDLERARKLLEEAGYSQGFEMKLLAQADARPYNPDAIKTAQLIRNDLAQIGIKVKIIRQLWPVIEKRISQGQYQSVLSGWTADNSDPDTFLRQLLSCSAVEKGNNYARWCSPAFDQLLDDAVRTSQLAARLRGYHYAQVSLNESLPLIPLAHALRTQISRSDVQGLALTPFGSPSFHQAYRE